MFPTITINNVFNSRFLETLQILRNGNNLTILANVQPPDAFAEELLAQYEYKRGGIRIWTKNIPLFTDTEDNSADLVDWQGKLYKVIAEYDWTKYAQNNGHFKYVAALINQPFTNKDQSQPYPQYKDPFQYKGRRNN